MREHGATRDEVNGTWEIVSDEGRGMRSFKAWVDSPDIGEQIRNYRTEAGYKAYDAEFASRGTCDFHRLPYPCRGCAADAKAASDET